jgi:cell division septal protein FtsQ
VRISLVDREQNRRGRQRSRAARRRRRYRSFNSAIVQPDSLAARRSRGQRTRGRQRGKPLLDGERPEARPRRSVWTRIHWHSLWVRGPAFLILLALGGLVFYVSWDARFFVYEAEIVGSQYLEPDTIYAAAEVDEQNIFWIRPEKVAERIAALPGIKSVRVRCSLPALVSIHVQEREPAVMWRTSAQEHDWWLDDEGVVLPYNGDADSPDAIFVVDSSDRQLEEGQRIEPAQIVRWAQQLARALPGARVLFYQSDRGLSFTQDTDGHQWPVFVGDGEDLEHKIQAVQMLDGYLAANDIHPSYVDVRWPNLPVYGKPEGSELEETN